MRVALRVRRFYCHNGPARAAPSAERLPGLIAVHTRHTRRLAAAQGAAAVTLGGEAGARLLPALAMPTSADTLLRLVRQRPLPAGLTPAALSVDDRLFKRGSTYGKLDAEQKAMVVQIEQDREVRKAGVLARRLTALVQASGVTHRRAPDARLATLRRWLSRANTCGTQALQSFAAGVQQNRDCIETALTTGWSNGQTEGHVNKLKLLKRQMYGRARFDLLRRRLLITS